MVEQWYRKPWVAGSIPVLGSSIKNFMKKSKNNLAFIDGQNLYLGITSDRPSWKIDLVKFRKYLLQKYSIHKAYYYLGFVDEKNQSLYEEIQNAGFILVFRQYNNAMLSNKKGKVDSDIIFNVMKRLYKKEAFDNIILVTGDGDYKMLVDFLIEENRFEKLLFPNRQYRSSLYKRMPSRYYDYLSNEGVKEKIKKGVPLGN